MSNIKDTEMQRQAQRILRQIMPWFAEPSSVSNRNNYKGVRGRIGIVGGARDYAGAPYFASISAMRLGADLAYVICSRDAGQVIKNYSPDLIVTPLLDCPDETEFQDEMSCLLSRLHVLVIGPGLGREDLLQKRAKLLFTKANSLSLPIVLDADGLLMVQQDAKTVQGNPNVLLTPNRIEMQRLLSSLYPSEKFDLRNSDTDGVRRLVKQYSDDMQVAVLAKGMIDIICDSSPPIELQTDSMSGTNRRCGGQGDITSGLAAAYTHWICQANKNSVEKIENKMAWAGFLAALTTRRSNELAYETYHDGMLASHMIDKIQEAMRGLWEQGTKRGPNSGAFRYSGLMSRNEIDRYARQMIMDEFGAEKQLRLKHSSALIIGAGGLGCPAAVYLGAGGIGRMGLVDDDRIEASNLHRQILHNMDKVGMLKTESIKHAVQAINPNVQIDTYPVRMNRHNAVDLIEPYDMVLDCTDNLLVRYMISDACVITGKPLISGAALKMDGQLTVYNYDSETPCFRCLFPEPPPLNAVGSCSDNGVLGVIPGIIGVQQALEALKLGAGERPAYAGKMLLFDGQLGLFRQVTLGKKKPDCVACGKDSQLRRTLVDYEQFCGSTCLSDQNKNKPILDAGERISVEDYRDIILSGIPHVLVDVRPKQQSDLSRLEHALQLPIVHMLNEREATRTLIKTTMDLKKTNSIYVVCRRGIASQRGTRIIQDLFSDHKVVVKDIVGGMTAWAKLIDPENYSCL